MNLSQNLSLFKSDKLKPKGALSPYTIFVQCTREEQKKKNPNANIEFAAFSKDCSAKWKVIKFWYEDLAAKDKERYNKQIKNYVPPEGDAKKKKKKNKDPNAPKKPMSAFLLFCQDERPKVRQLHPDWNVGQAAKELAARWEQCKNRSKYNAQAVAEKARYEKAVENYKKSKAGSESP
ncbi:unnamed protein product [Schistocephalus solidus]|uniref:HMG box domain-containing protein n=1 Tax=Schistocephalus solidus TaxID=70667 RepID=A0A3P7D4I4_SCHSO|nr:unnamed protein product [Schistocephalus solidus]